jgi:hypothetical protein
MRMLEMHGSYPLDDKSIDVMLSRTSPGNYALGYMDGDAFAVFYVGRSDVDVRGRLHEWVGMPNPEAHQGSFAKAPWCVQRRGPLPVDAPKFGRVVQGDGSYTRFAFSYAADATAAFEQECRNYDDFGGRDQLDNDAPPVQPRSPGEIEGSARPDCPLASDRLSPIGRPTLRSSSPGLES